MEEDETSQRRRRFIESTREKFGKFWDWEKPNIIKTVGPFHPEIFDEFDEACKDAVSTITKKMKEKGDEEVLAIVDPKDELQKQIQSDWDSGLAGVVKALNREEPSVVAGGFGHPKFEADFEYWGQMAKFTLDEALHLSLGIEPNYYSKRKLDEYTSQKGDRRYYPAIVYLGKRRIQFQRHFPRGFDDWYSITPKELKSWFDEISLDVDPRFYQRLEKRVPNPRQKEQRQQVPAKSISAVEKETLLKIVAAMAVRGYRFDPDARRNEATRDIRNDMELLGLGIDDKTLLKWLREACTILPKNKS